MRDWTKAAAKAERALERTRRLIDASPGGTTGGKTKGWRVGRGPGAAKVKR